MTETEKKALELLDAVAKERGDADGWGFVNREDIRSEALCRAIEQHEAFKREVSDAIDSSVLTPETEAHLSRFIIAKPDPLVEVLDSLGLEKAGEWAPDIRKALAARGFEVRKIGESA